MNFSRFDQADPYRRGNRGFGFGIRGGLGGLCWIAAAADVRCAVHTLRGAILAHLDLAVRIDEKEFLAKPDKDLVEVRLRVLVGLEDLDPFLAVDVDLVCQSLDVLHDDDTEAQGRAHPRHVRVGVHLLVANESGDEPDVGQVDDDVLLPHVTQFPIRLVELDRGDLGRDDFWHGVTPPPFRRPRRRLHSYVSPRCLGDTETAARSGGVPVQ
jgi:hypothetical protein